MQVLSIINWERFQHYKDRDPPWVKLYRDLLTSESWVLGNDVSRVVQVASTLLAPRYNNQIPYRFDLLKEVIHLKCEESVFIMAIGHLITTDFLEIQEVTKEVKVMAQSASTALATCPSESDQIRSDISSATPPKRKRVSRETDPTWLLDFKLAYPSRAGDQGWRKAVKASRTRIAEGHTPEEFIEGAKRYAAFCEAMGKVGTEFVRQASRFLGDEKSFLELWEPPKHINGKASPYANAI